MIKILIYLTFLLKTFYIFKYNIYTRDITYINKGDLIWAYLANQNKTILQEIEDRRTIYSTETTISISDKELEDMIEHIIKYTPSPFNSQSTRIVLLLNDQHHKFWDNTKTVLKDVMGPDRDFTPTEQRIDGFKHAYGTILYFEDEDVIKGLQEQMPNYR